MPTEQAIEALAHANRIKSARSRTKAYIRSLPYNEGRAILAELLLEIPPELAKMRVDKVLMIPHNTGEATVTKWKHWAGLPTWCNRRLEDLTLRERRALADEVRG